MVVEIDIKHVFWFSMGMPAAFKVSLHGTSVNIPITKRSPGLVIW